MKIFSIYNSNGIEVQILNYGGRVVKLLIPDKTGIFKDIVLGFDNPEDYLKSNEKYFGATIGRYANRIKKGVVKINNKSYQLSKNDDENTLHGGEKGFHNIFWEVTQESTDKVELTHYSKDGDEGFPGNLNVRVVYSLNDNNELKIEYIAETDKTTVLNLTHHSFFNLTGFPLKSINNHILQIPAGYFTPVGKGLIPTGEIRSVEGTPFDFRKPVAIGERIDLPDKQLIFGKGYDHNWILEDYVDKTEVHLAARVIEPISGRVMEVFTNEPGVQFYSGNFLNGSDIGKNNIAYNFRTAFCLETQHFPDSPNFSHFPSVVVNPDELYYSVCIYRFDTINDIDDNLKSE
ncbi:MAG: galactose mutarotase [Prolixibacteraceae bacterium]|nr:galactose mutarotase [Prolixibacteraceae bacterium]